MKKLDRSCKSSVYRVINTITGDDYIGVSVDPIRRWRDHRSAARRGSLTHFHRAWSKYGESVFTWEVLIWCADYDSALLTERYCRFLGMGKYNMTDGGEGVLGCSPSAETREKSASKRRGSKRSPETRKLMSQAKKGKPAHNIGVPASEQQKRKQSLTMSGRKPSEAALASLKLGRIVRWGDSRLSANLKQSEATRQIWKTRHRERDMKVVDLAHSGLSISEIAKVIGCGPSPIGKVLSQFSKEKRRNKNNSAIILYLSDSIPLIAISSIVGMAPKTITKMLKMAGLWQGPPTRS